MLGKRTTFEQIDGEYYGYAAKGHLQGIVTFCMLTKLNQIINLKITKVLTILTLVVVDADSSCTLDR